MRGKRDGLSAARASGLCRSFLGNSCRSDTSGCRSISTRIGGGASIVVKLLLSRFTGTFVTQLHIALPLSTEPTIPDCEERLRKVRLDSPALVVNVMVSGIVGCKMLQRIPGESIAAVIVNGFDGRKGEEPHALASRHPGCQECDASASSIEKESFNGMVVESAESIGNV